MDETIYQLVYCSRNTISDCQTSDTDAEIIRILEASRRNNVHDKVTGALLFSAGSFAQVLEGSLPAVE
ncbi:MAG: BLUF domain-containing protein, partial [Acetobacteraceae bacterium]|nr:BLUF domain-containing protein [Acetobacteraceae bacterium]